MSEKIIRFYALKSKDGVKLLEFCKGMDKETLIQLVNEFKEALQSNETYGSEAFLNFLKSKRIEVEFVITGGVIELN